MQSKGYKRFCDRLHYYMIDCEVADVMLINKETIAGEDDLIFASVTRASHPKLSNRSNLADSRSLIIRHLCNSIQVSFIKEMYEEVTEYMRYVLKEAALNGAEPGRLLGEHNIKVQANDILSKENYIDVVAFITSNVLQSLENERSTLDLLKKVSRKLDLEIDEDLINDALPYLEIRHIFVHSDGKPSQDFRNKYPFIRLRSNGRIELSLGVVRTAFLNVNNMIKEYDRKMIDKGFISANELVA